MEFRPCIDIHDGKVKQIVGGSLKEDAAGASKVTENYVSEQDAPFYARLYASDNITGGHIILLNKAGTEEYEATKAQALAALRAYPGGLQVGGGITADNAREFIEAGASHVIVTSYVFRDGQVDYEALKRISEAVGPKHLCIDLSCRKKPMENGYYVVTDRWQKFTDVMLTTDTMREFARYCDEFLIHAVDVEGKQNGVETELVQMLGEYTERKITYAGGVHSFEDLDQIRILGKNHVNVTIGSALSLFGGTMDYREVLAYMK